MIWNPKTRRSYIELSWNPSYVVACGIIVEDSPAKNTRINISYTVVTATRGSSTKIIVVSTVLIIRVEKTCNFGIKRVVGSINSCGLNSVI